MTVSTQRITCENELFQLFSVAFLEVVAQVGDTAILSKVRVTLRSL